MYTIEEICKAIRLELRVADARNTKLDKDSIDLVISNNTFEHVYPDVLAGILKEFWRVTKPGGIMSHFIDMSDHFAHLDKQITIYNFLKYSPKAWAAIDNNIQPQNRWRFIEYKALYQNLSIPFVERKIRPGRIEDLHTVNLAPPFSQMDEAEVAISHGYLISYKSF